MPHLEDGYLHAIADGEVPSDELVAVREHLDACESCRARLDQARGEAESARELIELIEVPVGPSSGRPVGRAGGQAGGRAGGRWIRPLVWAASLVLAAGVGYMTRSRNEAMLTPRLDPLSIGSLDTVFVEVPAQVEQDRPAEADLDRRETGAAATPPAPVNPQAPRPARQNAAGARAEEEQSATRRAGLDTSARLEEVVVTAADKKPESKDDNARLQESARKRDLAAAPPVAAEAQNRLMAKSATDEVPTIISFPRAVELLGGRIKLIEGMVPARLEAVGRTVRVIYVIDEGNLVLAQVAATDSLHWNLSGPLAADSLAALQRRIR
jgi:hypothetical protein